MGDCSLVQHF